jgi:hypothetical protein
MVEQRERDNCGKQAIAVRHCGSVSLLHMDIRIEQAMTEGLRQRGIDLKALDVLHAISHAVSGHARSWANLQHRIAEFYIPQRPWENLALYLLLPVTRSAVPSVESIHIALLPSFSLMHDLPKLSFKGYSTAKSRVRTFDVLHVSQVEVKRASQRVVDHGPLVDVHVDRCLASACSKLDRESFWGWRRFTAIKMTGTRKTSEPITHMMTAPTI